MPEQFGPDLFGPPESLPPQRHQELRSQLVALASESRIRRGGRRGVVAGAVAAAVLLSTGAAVAAHYLGTEPVTDDTTARCYTVVSTDFGDDFRGASLAAPQGSDNAGGHVVAPIAACAEAWRQGFMGTHDPFDLDPPYPVPHLVGCVLPNGIAAVFPGPDDTCAQLGLPRAARR